ncbi:Ribonuclease H1 [Anthophora quadrimaculata]
MIACRFFTLQNFVKNMPLKYYAVAKGRKPGIYNTWDECKLQVSHYSASIFKKFNSKVEAENFIKQHTNLKVNISDKDITSICNKRSQSQSDWSIENETEERKVKKRKVTTEKSIIKEHSKIICIESKKTSDYIIDSDGYVNVYTDGACSSNGRKNARAGIGVWFGDDHLLNVSETVVGRATNNMAEIQAVTVAAKQAKKANIKNLKINTDSQFLISCITNWMPKWKANGWMTSSNKPVINKVELLEMEKALESLNVAWNHVNGHVGIYGNEMADKLARAGCLKN